MYGIIMEIEQRIEPTDPGYARYSGTDGRPVFLVYGKSYRQSDTAHGRHVPVCADDEEDAKRLAGPVFAALPPEDWWQD